MSHGSSVNEGQKKDSFWNNSYQSFYWTEREGVSADYLPVTLSSEPWLSFNNYRHQGNKNKKNIIEKVASNKIIWKSNLQSQSSRTK